MTEEKSMQSEIKVSHTLFVGEGDFSFSANYILKKSDLNEKIIASCLNKDSLTERQRINIEIIEKNGGLVFTDVDATCLEYHPKVKELLYSKIIFNFPHIPGKMNIRANRQLVQCFFLSSAKILEKDGSVYVTLCRGQGGTDFEDVKRKWCDTWQIVSLAACASLVLYKVEFFDAKEFELYESTGFRGLQKSFHTEGALMHIFKHGKDVEINMDILINENFKNSITDTYQEDCKAIHERFYDNAQHPVHKILNSLKAIAEKVFQPSFYEALDALQACCKLSTNYDCKLSIMCLEGIDYFAEYINNLFTQFSQKQFVACVSCSLCCAKNVNIIEHPIHNLICFISNCAQSILNNLVSFLELLTQIYSLNTGKKKNSNENFLLNNKQKILQVMQQFLEPSSDNKYPKNLMNIYAKYSIIKEDGLFLNSDVEFLLMNDVQEINAIKETNKCEKIGSVLQYFKNSEKYSCIIFNLNNLACIKYHIRDYRTLLLDNCFYDSINIHGSLEEVYRSPSIYPPSYVHDISFYIDKDFDKNIFLKVVRNTVGFLIKSVLLIDSYYDGSCQKRSNCYRFVYQSCNRALTKEKANTIHTVLMRKVLQNSLNIILR